MSNALLVVGYRCHRRRRHHRRCPTPSISASASLAAVVVFVVPAILVIAGVASSFPITPATFNIGAATSWEHQHHQRRGRRSDYSIISSLSSSSLSPSSLRKVCQLIVFSTSTSTTVTSTADPDDDFSSLNDVQLQSSGDGAEGSLSLNRASSASTTFNTNDANLREQNPTTTEGGVIMPEGGANPCVIKVSERVQ